MRLRGCYLILCILFLTIKPFAFCANTYSTNSYESLLITQEQKNQITELLRTMAENNVLKLIFKQGGLKEIGAFIQPVHPLRFLGTVFTDKRLTGYMREIRKSDFKWEGFMKEGFVERMRREARHGNLLPYVPGFARAVSRNPERIVSYIEAMDFEGLVIFLLS